jgi:hypothetical protein
MSIFASPLNEDIQVSNQKRGRGRPKGSKNKSTLEREAKLNAPDLRTDVEIVDDIKTRFDIYLSMVQGAQKEAITSLVVSGSAGVGKSYTAEWALNTMKQDTGIRYKIVRGTISAIDLYALAYTYRHKNDIIVLDDADRIFEDEEGLNVLKSLLDSSHVRTVNWMTDHPRFKGETALPKEYEFEGAMIFLTNKDFQRQLDEGKGRYVEHMHALMSRSIYLDLKMHSRREVALWTQHLVIRNGILRQDPIGLNGDQEKMLVKWIVDRQTQLRELSIRTAIKLGKIFKMNPDQWEKVASILLLKEDYVDKESTASVTGTSG